MLELRNTFLILSDYILCTLLKTLKIFNSSLRYLMSYILNYEILEEQVPHCYLSSELLSEQCEQPSHELGYAKQVFTNKKVSDY